MDKLNKAIAYVPIAMSVWCAVLLLFFISSDWYAKNYYWLDNTDIVLCGLLATSQSSAPLTTPFARMEMYPYGNRWHIGTIL